MNSDLEAVRESAIEENTSALFSWGSAYALSTRSILSLGTLLISLSVVAVQAVEVVPCLGIEPVAAAESFYKEHKEFTQQEPKTVQNFMTTGFFDALSFEYRCRIGEGMCAIDADPWTAAQDGEIEKPIAFHLLSGNNQTATVGMHYTFAIDQARKEKRTAKIHLERNNPKGCWVVADLVSPDGSSIRQMIEEFRKEFGALYGIGSVK